MSVTPSSAIVGVFREQAMAEQAMDAFYNAGFTHEQVRRSVPENSGGFFEDLKNLFTGSSNASGDVASDLTGMGLSEEESQYYAQEHKNGNTILAVHAPGREQEAQSMMQQFGAYSAPARTNYALQNKVPTTNDSQQDVTSTETPSQESYAGSTTTPDTLVQQPAETQQSQQYTDPTLASSTDLTEQSTTENAPSDPYHSQETASVYNTASSDTVHSGSDEDTEPRAAHSAATDSTEHDVQPVTADSVNRESYNSTHDHAMLDQTFQPEAGIYNTETGDSQQATTLEPTHDQLTNDATPTYYSDQQAQPSSLTQDSQFVTPAFEPHATYPTDTTQEAPSVVDENATSTEPHTTYSSETTPIVDENTTSTEPNIIHPVETTQEATSVVEPSTTTEPEATHLATDTHDAQSSVNDTTTPQSNVDVQDVATEPLGTVSDHPVTGNHDAQGVSSIADSNGMSSQPETVTPIAADSTDSTTLPEEVVTPVVTDSTDSTTIPQETVAPVSTSETAMSTQPSQSVVGSATGPDDVQQLQTQLEAMQQHLQDVRAQLQAAKDHETNLRTAKERQQQVETLRQQMQALQAELAAAHAELQDTHARISQYQS